MLRSLRKDIRKEQEEEKSKSESHSTNRYDTVCDVCRDQCSHGQPFLHRTSSCHTEIIEPKEQCGVHTRVFSLKVSPFGKGETEAQALAAKL